MVSVRRRVLKAPIFGRFNAALGKPHAKVNMRTVLICQGKGLNCITSSIPGQRICITLALSLLRQEQATLQQFNQDNDCSVFHIIMLSSRSPVANAWLGRFGLSKIAWINLILHLADAEYYYTALSLCVCTFTSDSKVNCGVLLLFPSSSAGTGMQLFPGGGNCFPSHVFSKIHMDYQSNSFSIMPGSHIQALVGDNGFSVFQVTEVLPFQRC